MPFVLARHRQRGTHRDEHAAADLIEAFACAFKRGSNAMREKREHVFDGYFYRDEYRCHDDKLHE